MARTKKAPAVATVAERQANSRAQRAAAGGKAVTVMLTPEAAAGLAALMEKKGWTATAAINHQLARFAP